MPDPVAYEPSVEAILHGALPPDCRLVAGEPGLRKRVSWTRLARATGLGALEGGELILASSDHAPNLLARLRDLAGAGVAGLAVAAEDTSGQFEDTGVPVIVLPLETDMRRVQGDVERFIARRRRELFQLQQELHRSLVDAALGGAPLRTLVEAAAARCGGPVAVDRSGVTEVAGASKNDLKESVLAEARLATHETEAPVAVAGPPPSVALAIRGGKERYGLVLIAGVGPAGRDDAEAVASALASACAILLARRPAQRTPTVAEVLRGTAALERTRAGPHGGLVAVALRDGTSSLSELERAVTVELRLRSISYLTAADGPNLVTIVDSASTPLWESIVNSTGRRLGSRSVVAGVGRQRESLDEIEASYREACDALHHAANGGVTRFESIELRALLGAEQGWRAFARSRLAPLLGSKPSDVELLRTLRAYLDAGRNAKEAARRLHVHRNTLLYRLRRISQLLDADLEDADQLFELDLASRVLAISGMTTAADSRSDSR